MERPTGYEITGAVLLTCFFFYRVVVSLPSTVAGGFWRGFPGFWCLNSILNSIQKKMHVRTLLLDEPGTRCKHADGILGRKYFHVNWLFPKRAHHFISVLLGEPHTYHLIVLARRLETVITTYCRYSALKSKAKAVP
ncbi:hypothetical protein F4778DRAFT_446239 [Xylariomycetidae sp. FL2044]|nr:hypothetical protein F4778DRAFT_446239 [Xylariomycetidae sp. FL2044]